MGRNISTASLTDRPPVYMSCQEDFTAGVSFTTTKTLVTITGSGVVDLLALYNTRDVTAPNFTTMRVHVDIDGNRAISLSDSIASGSLSVIGNYEEGNPGVSSFQPIAFKSSFVVACSSSGQEQSLSMRGIISYRTL